MYLLWGKVAQMPLFLGLGWPWVGELVGFTIMFICFPTQHNVVNRKHPIVSTTVSFEVTPYQPLYRFMLLNINHCIFWRYPVSTIVSFDATPYQPLYRLMLPRINHCIVWCYPVSTIVSFDVTMVDITRYIPRLYTALFTEFALFIFISWKQFAFWVKYLQSALKINKKLRKK